MYRRIVLGISLGLSLGACVPYYAEPGYYRSEVYTVPAPYYYGNYYYTPYYYGGFYGPRYYGHPPDHYGAYGPHYYGGYRRGHH